MSLIDRSNIWRFTSLINVDDDGTSKNNRTNSMDYTELSKASEIMTTMVIKLKSTVFRLLISVLFLVITVAIVFLGGRGRHRKVMRKRLRLS